MRVQDQEIKFNVFKAIKFPTNEEECFKMDIIDQIISEDMNKSLVNNPFKMTLLRDEEFDDSEFVDYLQMLDSLS